ncbi:MAG: antitermination regulator, partial [Nitrospirota bacterium]
MAFNGMTIAAFETRMATELARLIERHGGRPLVTAALREISLEDNSATQEFGVRLMAGRVDLLILMTGIGTTTLFDLLKTSYSWPILLTALQRFVLVA